MKFFRMMVMVIFLLTVLYYGSSYLFKQLRPGQAKELIPPFMIWGMDSITRPDTPKGGNPTPGSSGTLPNQDKPDLTGDPANKETAPETIKPQDDQAKAKRIIITRFSRGDLAALRDLAKDGLTEEEKSKALAIIRSRLTKEEFELLYHKYYLPQVKDKLNN